MAEIKAFKPLRYTVKAGKIENNVCPPYDIVNGEARQTLCEKSPYNLIRLELPEGSSSGEGKYKTAAKLLNEFISKGVLAKDDEEGIFIYEEEFTLGNVTKVLDGLVCLCKTYDFSEKIVLPHEETLSKAKKDRFDLMSETFCNFSSVYSLYSDGEGYIQGIIDKYKKAQPIYEFTDGDGVTHRLWKISGEKNIKDIEAFFAPRQLFIADGHHRYETANAFHKYCVENNMEADSGYIMMTLVDMDSPGLAVLPTHRLIVDMKVDSVSLAEKAGKDFDVRYCDDFSKVAETLDGVSDKHAFALYTGGNGFRLFTLKNEELAKGSAVKELDVSVLHDLVLEKLLGIDKANMASQKNLIYTRSVDEAKAKVDGGAASAAFILNPTKVFQIKKVALEGSKMPQKSTYFYPKLITGLLINQFKELN
jgi:uncharacterized protein (DUF1015 family)